jgi:serine/threonine-protein kinase
VTNSPTFSHSSERLASALADRYRIEREIGRGGMAAVYLAHDVRHGRQVAVKVLDPELGAVLGAERFLAEIRVTANLQHPNLLPLFDSGSVSSHPERSEGPASAAALLYYVMPFVEGESLRHRIDRERQLPIADALRIAREIASALEYAHRHGIVHRDIKPENVLLHDGRAMIADFGIALAVQSAGAQRMTQTGLSLGTPQYMSPEQAIGEKTIDARADIYALGAVLYEMLTGDPPFTGSSVQAIVAKVLNERPTPVSVLRDTVPPSVEQAILRSLAKLPADRFQTAKEFADALDTTQTRDASATMARTRRAQPRWSDPVVLALAAMLIAAIGLAAWKWRAADVPHDEAVVRFPIEIGRYVSAGAAIGNGIAISPDGQSVAYIGGANSALQQVLLRTVNDTRPRPIAGTDAAQLVMFKPDGKSIAVWIKGRLVRVPLDGGPSVLITQGQPITGASWGSKGLILLSNRGRLMTISEAGGTATPVPADPSHPERSEGTPSSPSHPERSEGTLSSYEEYPVFLDDGETALVVSGTESPTQRTTIVAVSVRTGKRTPLGLEATFVAGVMDNTLVYATSTFQQMAVPFDQKSLRVRGTPIQVMTIPRSAASVKPLVAASSGGTLVYAEGSTAAEMVKVDLRGVATPLNGDVRVYLNPRFSPDGKQVALNIGEGNAARIWLYELSGRTFYQFSDSAWGRPEWSSDGRRLIFRVGKTVTSTAETPSQVWWQPVDKSGPAGPIFDRDNDSDWEGVMTPDGKGVVVQRDLASKNVGANVIYRAFGDTTVVAISETSAEETQPRPSPDSKWVAFQLGAPNGTSQVVVKSITGKGAPVIVSPTVGTEPVWSRDGKHLYYRDGQQFVDATYATSPDFRILSRTPLFADVYAFAPVPHANYDVYPDGSGFLALRPTEGRRLVVAHNWKSELRQIMAARAGR